MFLDDPPTESTKSLQNQEVEGFLGRRSKQPRRLAQVQARDLVPSKQRIRYQIAY